MKTVVKFASIQLTSVLVLLLLLVQGVAFAGNKVVIAHRGASGYLPEHSMAAKAMAYAMGVDYIEQDVAMTKDDQLVVLHDHYLDRVTNVADVYPDRKRKDDRYYVMDFTLAEIRGLAMTEGFEMKDGKRVPVFPDRFPIWKSSFRVHTLQEEIEMIQGLNKSTGRNVGIYTEIKAPWLHRHEGKEITRAVLEVLKEYGYTRKSNNVYLQCFDPNELKRIRNELFPEMEMDLKLIQLIAENDWDETMVYDKEGKAKSYDYSWMLKQGAMAKIAEYADGIGPWTPQIVKDGSTRNKLIITDMVQEAHAAGMKVHPYTFRLDQGQIPPYAASFEELIDILLYTAGVDGIFTDFPDRAVNYLRRAEYQRLGL